ncbi:MAG: porin family protein [Hyphomicrobiales bacterium]|nr:porin family protein [Hyphomicrobiales bacterium]
MLSKTALCLFTAAALAAPALAADLPVRTAPVAYAAPAPIFTWTGFYVGLNAGYGGGRFDTSNSIVYPGLAAGYGRSTFTANGFLIGGQAGYNYQLANNVVLGVEGDIAWSNIKNGGDSSSVLVQNGFAPSFSFSSSHAKADLLGGLRLRAGYAMGAFMPYLTGGLAFTRLSVNTLLINGTSFDSATASSTKLGWAVGAGFEYMLMPNVSVKTEYLYSQFSGLNYRYIGNMFLNPTEIGSLHTVGLHSVRAGLNYHFNFGGAPVVAKY